MLTRLTNWTAAKHAGITFKTIMSHTHEQAMFSLGEN